MESNNWNLCALCQKEGAKEDILKCPADRPGDSDTMYIEKADLLSEFQKMNSQKYNWDRLNEDGGIGKTFIKQRAKWHKTCSLKFTKTMLKRDQLKRKSTDKTENDDSTTPKRPRHSRKTLDFKSDICFFCDTCDEADNLREVRTFQLDYRVRKCAENIQDLSLLAKLSAGDMIAQEAKYHAKCLLNLYRETARSDRDYNDADAHFKGAALAELISYINDENESNDHKVFRLKDLVNLYKDRLNDMGVKTNYVRSTSLKHRLLLHVPGLVEYPEGRDTFLTIVDSIGNILRKAYQKDEDEQHVNMMNIVQAIRHDVFSHPVKITTHYDKKCQTEAIPNSLFLFVNMLLNGPNINNIECNSHVNQSVLTIAQLIQFNCVKQRQVNPDKMRNYHSQEREPPIVIYTGIKQHAATRKRKCIDSLNSLGLCPSYDRLQDIITGMGNRVADHYNDINVVSPPQLHPDTFTIGAIDNADHNPSSNTSVESFHGTSLSLFQNITDDSTESRVPELGHTINTKRNKRNIDHELPEYYTNIVPLILPSVDVYIPKVSLESSCSNIGQHIEKEKEWLEHASTAINMDIDTVKAASNLSWPAYHSSQLQEKKNMPFVNAILPIFKEQAASAAMIRHGMEVIKKAVDHVNPGQAILIAMDLPLFAIGKHIQWAYPDKYGEDKYFLTLGDLHIEQMFYAMLDKYFDGSGFVEILEQVRVNPYGIAKIKRTRNAHHIFATVLHAKLNDAYDIYKSDEEFPLSFSNWCDQRCEDSPQFLYRVIKSKYYTLSYKSALTPCKM